MTAILPAGKYYVGDLCYVLGDLWDEVCSLIIVGNDLVGQGEVLTLKNGTKFVYFNTAYGDGTYRDDELLYSFSVDAGMIGAVLVNAEDVDMSEAEDLGAEVVFDHDWTAYKEDTGVMWFGDIRINTAHEEDDYDAYDYEEEDDY